MGRSVLIMYDRSECDTPNFFFLAKLETNLSQIFDPGPMLVSAEARTPKPLIDLLSLPVESGLQAMVYF